jgi:phage terminase small subunit
MIKLSSDAYDEMAKSGEKLGMSVSSRLKAAEVRVKKEEEDLKQVFGEF